VLPPRHCALMAAPAPQELVCKQCMALTGGDTTYCSKDCQVCLCTAHAHARCVTLATHCTPMPQVCRHTAHPQMPRPWKTTVIQICTSQMTVRDDGNALKGALTAPFLRQGGNRQRALTAGHSCRNVWSDHAAISDHSRRQAARNTTNASDPTCTLIRNLTPLMDDVHGFDTLGRSVLLVTSSLSYLHHPGLTLASIDAHGHVSLCFFCVVTILASLVLMHYLSAIYVIAYIQSLGRFSQGEISSDNLNELAILQQHASRHHDANHHDTNQQDTRDASESMLFYGGLREEDSTLLGKLQRWMQTKLPEHSVHMVGARLRGLQEAAARIVLYPYPLPTTLPLQDAAPLATCLTTVTMILTALQGLTLFVKSDAMSANLSALLMHADSVFLLLFVIQCLLTMLAHGPHRYLALPLCRFELVITAVTLIGWLAQAGDRDVEGSLSSGVAAGSDCLPSGIAARDCKSANTGNSFRRSDESSSSCDTSYTSPCACCAIPAFLCSHIR
jgi:hypothetical protein